MAEELGVATLRLEVDDSAAKRSLELLRQQIATLSQQASKAGGRVGGGGRGGQGSRYPLGDPLPIRTQERAQERRFQLARRINNLEEKGVDVSRLRAALGRLTEAQSKREFENARRQAVQLRRQVQLAEDRYRIDNARQRQQVSAARAADQLAQREVSRNARQGGATESVDALERARERRFRLAQKIDRLESQGANVSRLRTNLGRLSEAIGNRQFGTAQQLSNELSRQVRLDQARLRLQREQEKASGRVTRAAEQEGRRIGRLNAQPVSGRTAAGTIPGSPAAIREEEKLARARERARQAAAKATDAKNRRIGGLNSSPVRGGRAFPGSPAAIELLLKEGLRIGGLNAVPVTGKTPTGNIPGSPAAIAAEKKLAEERTRTAAATQKAEIAEGRRIGKLNTSPLRGGAAFPGSPEFFKSIAPPPLPKGYWSDLQKKEQQLTAARRRAVDVITQTTNAERKATATRKNSRLVGRLSNTFDSAIIGGAFPLLFGQGPGASLGGLTGGLLGGALGGAGGFAGSLLGTVIGQTADQFTTLAKALQDPVAALPQLIEGFNLSGTGTEQLAAQLIELGQTAQAQRLILSDATRGIDPQTVITAAAAQDAYQRSVAQLQTKLGAFLAGPASQFLDWLSSLAQGVPGGNASGGPTRQSALGLRALGVTGAATGLALAGIAGATALANPLLGVGLAAGAAGAFGAGSLAIGAADSQEQQIANAKALQPILAQINATESERISIQSKLLSLKGQEKDKAQEIRKLTRDSALKEIEARKLQLKANTLATPGTLSPAQVEAYRNGLAALKLQGEAVEKQFQIDTKEADKLGTAVEDAFRGARQTNLDGQIAGVQGRFIAAAVAAGQLRDSFSNIEQALRSLDQERTTLDVNSGAFIEASVDIAVVQNQLDQLDGRKAEVEVQVLSRGLDSGLLTNSFNNIQRLAEGFRTIANTSDYGSPRFSAAVQGYQNANRQLEIVAGILSGAFKSGADAVRQAAEKANDVLRNGYSLLKDNVQGQLLSQARNSIDYSIFDYRKLGLRFQPGTQYGDPGGNTQSIFQAAELTKQYQQAQENLRQTVSAAQALERATDAQATLESKRVSANAALVESNQNLGKAMYDLGGIVQSLTDKSWEVNVAVNAGSGRTEVKLG